MGDRYCKGVATRQKIFSENWRLPTEKEFKDLLEDASPRGSYYLHKSGLIVSFGMYTIIRPDGSRGYILLPEKVVNRSSSPALIRLVQNMKCIR